MRRRPWVLLTSACLVAAALAPAAADAPWPAAVTISDVGVTGAPGPGLATAPDGTTTAVWTRLEGAHYLVETSTRAPGGAWSTPVTLSEAGQNAAHPQVATAPDGTTTAIWERFDGFNYLIQLRTRPAGAVDWKPVLTLTEPEKSAFRPRIAYGPDGIATAVWERNDDTHLMIQVSRRSLEGVWTVPLTLSAVGQENRDPRIAIATDGTAVVVWRRADGLGEYRMMTSAHPAGGNWSTPDFISDALTDGAPDVAASPDGTTTAVWIRDDGANKYVRARTRTASGTWAATETLSEFGQAFVPAIASGPTGSTVTWLRSDGSNLRVTANHRSPGGAWGSAAMLSEPGHDATQPLVSTGPDGSALVVWSRSDGQYYRTQAVTREPSGAWSPVANVSAAGAEAVSPSLSVGRDGTTAIVWVEVTVSFRVRAVVVEDLLTTEPAAVVPDTSAVQGKQVIKKAKAKYTFTSTPAGATFECRVDKKFKKYVGVSKTKAKKQVPWKACTSPYVVKAKKLQNGKHKLYVRAVLAGQTDPTPSVKKVTVRRG